MEEFTFDRVVTRENICDLEATRAQINKPIKSKQNVVIYARRNYGKTSLVKNVIIDDFRKANKKSLTLFVDLMGVKDIESITLRLKQALELAIKESFPVRNLLTSIGEFFTNLKPTISFDAAAGTSSISLESHTKNKQISISDIFKTVEKISKKMPTLIALDEFQDVSLVDEAEPLFRDAFQQLSSTPIIVLGSKKHLLQNIFAIPKSPLAGFGSDVVIGPIDYKKYHQYINKRFAAKKIKIALDDCKYLQDLVQRQPEAVNILCHKILESNRGIKVDQKLIHQSLQELLMQRNKRFEIMLESLSIAEKRIITALAKNNGTTQPQSKSFTAQVDLTPRAVKLNIVKLMDRGIIDTDDGTYQVCDPLLNFYLKTFR